MVKLETPNILTVIGDLAALNAAVRDGRATMYQGPSGWVVEWETEDGDVHFMQFTELGG